MVVYQGDGYALETGPDDYTLRAPGGMSLEVSHDLMDEIMAAAFRVRNASYGQILAAAWIFLIKG